jgi:hypothetical protein
VALLLSIIAWIVGVLATVLLGWALVGDRSRGRRRCPKCWYDLAGIPIGRAEAENGEISTRSALPRCPECGREVRREGDMFRTRRRWRWAIASLPLFTLAYAAFVGPHVLERGARGAIPGAALVYWPWDVRALAEPDLYPPPAGRISRFAFDELETRLDEHRLSRWETGVLQRRLREAYARIGRLGVIEEERRAIEALEFTPFVAKDNTIHADAVRAELQAHGFSINVGGESGADGHQPLIDVGQATTLSKALDELAMARAQAWTVTGRQVMMGDPRAVAVQTRYAVIDLRELAPVRVRWVPDSDCGFATTDEGPLRREVDKRLTYAVEQTLMEFFDTEEWIPNGGSIADLSILDDTIVVRARASTIGNIERFLEDMRRAHTSGGRIVESVARPSVNAGARSETRIKWYLVSDVAEQYASNPPSDVEGESIVFWKASRRRQVASLARDLIQNSIDHEHWESNGGIGGKIAIIDAHLVISTTCMNHAAIADLLDRLRRGEVLLPPG